MAGETATPKAMAPAAAACLFVVKGVEIIN